MLQSVLALYRKISMQCKSEDGSEKVVYQSPEVSGILTPCYVGIVVNRQTESTYIGMERKCSWVAHGSSIQVLNPNFVASH